MSSFGNGSSPEEVFRNGPSIAVLASIFTIFLLMIMAILVYQFEVTRNKKLHPNDPGYHAWMHGSQGGLVRFLVFLAFAIMTVLLLLAFLATIFVFPGPQFVRNSRVSQQHKEIRLLEHGIASAGYSKRGVRPLAV